LGRLRKRRRRQAAHRHRKFLLLSALPPFPFEVATPCEHNVSLLVKDLLYLYLDDSELPLLPINLKALRLESVPQKEFASWDSAYDEIDAFTLEGDSEKQASLPTAASSVRAT
jgi:hypothetical protein